MHSYSIKNKNMHFHIIHSMKIMHSMYMFMCSQCTHASLPGSPYKKINNIKNEKYCIHTFTSLLSRFILRPGHGLNSLFFLIPFEILSAL